MRLAITLYSRLALSAESSCLRLSCWDCRHLWQPSKLLKYFPRLTEKMDPTVLIPNPFLYCKHVRFLKVHPCKEEQLFQRTLIS